MFKKGSKDGGADLAEKRKLENGAEGVKAESCVKSESGASGGRVKCKKLGPRIWLVISLCVCLVSMIFSAAFQSDFGKVKVSELRLVDSSGYEVSAQLYKPDSATAKNKAPAIVTVEGWFNNKEMQDLFSVEYARRGFVVMAVDMHGHGDSEATSQEDLYTSAVGIDAAVQQVAGLPYVDTSKIGITGHSSGGAACDMEIAIDNERTKPLVSAVLFQASTWVDDTGVDHSQEFGKRSVGIIADKYDEFFFWTQDSKGSDVSPRDFFKTEEAKSFYNFGKSDGTKVPVPGKYNVDGEVNRVIYQTNSTHPWVHFSKAAVADGIEFFSTVFGAPRSIAPTKQIWQGKALFNALGLIGIVMFCVFFMLSLLETSYFKILKSDSIAEPRPAEGAKAKLWFWVPLAVTAVFSPFCFYWCIVKIYGVTTTWFTQNGPLLMGLWSLICGVFAALISVLYYFTAGKKAGYSFTDTGIHLGAKKAWRTIVLALFTIVCAMFILFFADYFFRTDFRLWVLTLKAFNADKVILALKYLPLFLVFYVVNSVEVNCFNYNTIGGKKGHGNIVILAFMNVIGLIIFECIQYITFVQTGLLKWYSTEGFRICGIWLFPAIIYLLVSPFVSRYIYKRTNNPYLGGIVNAALITLMCVANTTTILGGAAVVASNY